MSTMRLIDNTDERERAHLEATIVRLREELERSEAARVAAVDHAVIGERSGDSFQART